MLILDRTDERAEIENTVQALGSGRSSVLVLAGEAGMGKTTLLRYAVECASDFRCSWIAGVEAESDLGYAALHRLMRPLLPQSDQLPAPQRSALESAFGLRADATADRFLVGLACLNLLADFGSEQGLLCVVDDAQWVDRESLEALTFVARQLDADRVALLFGVREPCPASSALEGLPTLRIDGLPDDAALELLSESVDTPVDHDTARRIVGVTSGCPLALVELASRLTQQQLQGGEPLGEALPIGRQLEEHFLRTVRSVDERAQTFLLVAATETSGDTALVRRVAFELGADAEAEDAAIASGLVIVHPTVSFRHPLIRTAIYSGASRSHRDEVHTTLARLIGRTDLDRQVLHLAAAARQPDPDLALELERAAERSARRGGYSAEAQFLLESAQLSPDAENRGRRFLQAATAARNAGLQLRAETLLERARSLLTDPLLIAKALRLEGRLKLHNQGPRAAPALLYKAATALEPLDSELAADTYLEALQACAIAQEYTEGTSPEEIAKTVLSSPRTPSPRARTEDLFLEGMAYLFVADFDNAMRMLHEVAPVLRAEDLTREQIAAWYNLALIVTDELHDDETYNIWVQHAEEQARADGALYVLQVLLLGRAKLETRAGDLLSAEMAYDEVVEVTRLVDARPEFWNMLRVDLQAWRGQETETRTTAEALRRAGVATGSASAVATADLALGTLDLGLGRYADALTAVSPLVETNRPEWTSLALPIGVEAAVRSGRYDRAEQYVEQLRRRTEPSGTRWARGQYCRCKALVAHSDIEALHREATRLLAMTSVRTELAQAHLGYGEWLRRQGRQVDARSELRVAFDLFSEMGAEAFAARARSELSAAGEQIHRRRPGVRFSLTSQEARAAQLAAGGATNAEIAGQMFISANTVDYHLRKVYRKLGISSRRDLSGALSDFQR